MSTEIIEINETIKEVCRTVPGMITELESQFLYNLAQRCSKGVIVEIGANAGRSTISLAKGSKAGFGKKVYSIDPHNGGGATPDPTWWDTGHPGIPDLKYYINQGQSFLPFRQRLEQHNVKDIVFPVVEYSELAYKNWRDVEAGDWDHPIELLFIDADHRYSYVKMDFEMWGKHLISGGVILMHDSTYTGVRRVINESIINNPRFTNIKETPIFNATIK